MMNYILVKTLRYDPISKSRIIIDPSNHVIEVRLINFEEEYPKYHEYTDSLIWVPIVDDYNHFVINSSLLGIETPNNNERSSNLFENIVFNKIVNIAISFTRDNKLNELGID